MKSNLECKIANHGQHEIIFICTDKNCDEQDRKLCPFCLRAQRHRHSRINNDHIKSLEEFSCWARQKQRDCYEMRCQYNLKFAATIDRLKKFVGNMSEQLKTFWKCISDFEKNKISEEDNKQIENLLDEKNYLSCPEILNKAINIDKFQYSTSEQLRVITQKLINIWNFFKEEMQEQVEEKIKNCKFEITKLESIKLQGVVQATTSIDLCYLSLLNDYKIEVWDLKSNTKLYENELDQQDENTNQKINTFHTAQFTLDSKYLYYGQGFGKLNRLSLENVKKQDQVQLNCQFIDAIKILTNDRMLLGTSDKQIIDYEWGRIWNDLFTLKQKISLIEYFNSYNMILSVNDVNELQFWDLNKQIEIETMKFDTGFAKIKQIEIIKKSNQLFILDQCKQLRVFKIKYTNEHKSCDEYEYLGLYNIYSIEQVFGQNYYIIINDNFVRFYDTTNDNHIRSIQHNFSYDCTNYYYLKNQAQFKHRELRKNIF